MSINIETLLHVYDDHTACEIQMSEGSEDEHSKPELIDMIRTGRTDIQEFRDVFLAPAMKELSGLRSAARKAVDEFEALID